MSIIWHVPESCRPADPEPATDADGELLDLAPDQPTLPDPEPWDLDLELAVAEARRRRRWEEAQESRESQESGNQGQSLSEMRIAALVQAELGLMAAAHLAVESKRWRE